MLPRGFTTLSSLFQYSKCFQKINRYVNIVMVNKYSNYPNHRILIVSNNIVNIQNFKKIVNFETNFWSLSLGTNFKLSLFTSFFESFIFSALVCMPSS
jgi:hypothetical protein